MKNSIRRACVISNSLWWAVLLALVVAWGYMIWSPAANAQRPVCAARGETINHLLQRYAEKPIAMGMSSNGGIIEFLASKNGKSWTIISTLPNGISCLIAAGEDWEILPVPLIEMGPGL